MKSSTKELRINKRSPSNKRVALGKNPKINNRRGYYYSIGKSIKQYNQLSQNEGKFGRIGCNAYNMGYGTTANDSPVSLK